MRFAASRLVELAFELAIDAEAPDGRSQLALLLAAIVFLGPRTAAAELLGL
jgi:hypothetical protein